MQGQLGEVHGGELAAGHPAAEFEAARGAVLVDGELGQPWGGDHQRAPAGVDSADQAAAKRSAHSSGTEVLTLTKRSPKRGDW